MADSDSQDPSVNPDDPFNLEHELAKLVEKDDPWNFLETLRGTKDIHLINENYDKFILLLTNRTPPEQDQLLMTGREIFKYRIDTARSSLKRMMGDASDIIKVVPGFVHDSTLGEAVYDPKVSPLVKFVVYKDGTWEISDRVKIGNTTYVPISSSFVEKRSIYVAAKPEEYGDNDALFREIKSFIHSYVQIEDTRFRNLVAYYILMTWVYDRFEVVPYLRALGDFASGKSRLLQVAILLSYRATVAAGTASPSALFRVIDMMQGTLILDEADFEQSEVWSEVIKILNQGYMSGFPVMRSEGGSGQWKPTWFEVYGPKILATRRAFRDQAVESRCFTFKMGPVQLRADIPSFLGPDVRARALGIRNKLLMWRFRNHHLVVADPYLRYPDFDPRMNQIVTPLMSCMQDESMKKNILEMISAYQADFQEERRETTEGKLAVALVKRCAKTKDLSHGIPMKEIAEQLALDNDGMRIEARSMAPMIRQVLGIPTLNRGGVTKVMITTEQLDNLYNKYKLENIIPRS